jgi:hypothetical protein
MTTKATKTKKRTPTKALSKPSSAKKPRKNKPLSSIKQQVVSVLPQSPATTRKPVQCWALSRSGQRCRTIVKNREGEPIPIPYCDCHLKSGDYALKTVDHPFAGTCLVARFELPPHYRMAFHGMRGKCPTSDREDRSISYYPPNPVTGSNCIPSSRTLRSDNYNGVLNPKDTRDVLQYAACPGPTERQNCRSTFRYFGKRNGRLGGLEFIALETIPKNTLLCHWYGAGWWSARNIKRQDVGSPKYPAPKRPAPKREKVIKRAAK